MKSFWRFAGAGGGFAVLVTLVLLTTGWGSAVASTVTRVLITNTADKPVPVAQTGTVPVNVQNLPSSQTVNGTVSVDNFPSTQRVAEVSSSTVYRDGTKVDGAPGGVRLIDGDVVARDQSVRLDITCSGDTACADVRISVVADGNLIDLFTIGGSLHLGQDWSATRTYEMPGQVLVVDAGNTNSNMSIRTELAGRSNGQ